MSFSNLKRQKTSLDKEKPRPYNEAWEKDSWAKGDL